MDRVTVESSRIERRQLRPGDHIFVWRTKRLTRADNSTDDIRIYSHHGIYESEEKVIQLSWTLLLSSIPDGPCPRCRGANKRRGDVVVCCLDCFLGRGELCLFAYAVPKWFYDERNAPSKRDILAPIRQLTCSRDAEDPPETVLRRANDLLLGHGHGGGGGGRSCYDPVHNNCFHFAFYCKTGRQYEGPVALVVDVVVETSKAALMLRALGLPSGDGPKSDRTNGSGGGGPEATRIVFPPESPARHIPPPPPESPARYIPPPPGRRWLRPAAPPGRAPFSWTNFGAPGPAGDDRGLFGQQTIFGTAAGLSAGAVLFRMVPFFL